MNDQSGVKSSEGRKTNQAGVSAGCLQGADQTIKFQEDVITLNNSNECFKRMKMKQRIA